MPLMAEGFAALDRTYETHERTYAWSVIFVESADEDATTGTESRRHRCDDSDAVLVGSAVCQDRRPIFFLGPRRFT